MRCVENAKADGRDGGKTMIDNRKTKNSSRRLDKGSREHSFERDTGQKGRTKDESSM